jgi:thiamine biosynthesis lipoprotein
VTTVEVLDLSSCRFRAMGTDVHVLVLNGVDDDLHWADAEVERLEALWSRFRDDSDVTRLNERTGRWVEVAPETGDLLGAAIAAWHATSGAFDPLLGTSLAALGYDRSFEAIDLAGAGSVCPPLPPARRHPDDLEVDPAGGRARVAAGRSLDLGGLGKGWTADLLVAALRHRGAAGACANLGGDVAASGRAPHEDGWHVDVDHRAACDAPGVLTLRAGGLATSTTLRRAWRGPGGDARHHLLDPRWGRPCRGDLVEATVVAKSAAQAEVLTKVAFVDVDLLDASLGDGAAILTFADGTTRTVGAPVARAAGLGWSR